MLTGAFLKRNKTEYSVQIFREEKDGGVSFDWRKRVPLDELDIGDIECAPLYDTVPFFQKACL